MSSFRHRLLMTIALTSLAAGRPGAQLLPALPAGGLGNVGRALGALPPAVGAPLSQLLAPAERQTAIAPSLDRVAVPDAVASLTADSLLELRRLRLHELVSTHSRELDLDERGNPVRRGVLVAADPDPQALAAAAAAGFRTVGIDRNEALGLTTVTLSIPDNLKARDALKRVHRAAPGLEADYDHVYEPSGGSLAAVGGALAIGGSGSGPAVAMIDGGVAAHPSLAGASIEQRAFAGSAKATGHGTAVASLLVGSQGPFHGAAQGARLYVADVYGGSPAAGSASAIVRALGWAASKHPDVISISLVGPGNRLLERAVQLLAARGVPLVAAVGNDGPAAPVQYPAAYPGVLAVTAVDGHDRALPEAGRAAKLDYAAPGADMAAALPGSGYARVRGTSFATPLVAARIAEAGMQRLPGEALPGRGKVGRGIVCRSCRIDPRLVGAK
ncbi:MAG: S8 family serine peptidase [Sphingomicrobium sp.]